jgi:hypothetical protein
MNKGTAFKTGTTFRGRIRMVDMDSGAGIPITENMSFASTLQTAVGVLIAHLEVVPFAEQSNTANSGWVLLSYSGSTTAWPAGTAVTDVKISIAGEVMYTATQSFSIVKSITQ